MTKGQYQPRATANRFGVIKVGSGLSVSDGVLSATGGEGGGGDMLAANNLSDVASAATSRQNLGLEIGVDVQPYASALDDVSGVNTGDQDLSGLMAKASNLSDVANAGTARTNLGLVIGTHVQAYDAGLLSLASLATGADKMPYTTAADTYAETALTPFARTLLDDADAATARTTLGITSGVGMGTVQAAHLNMAQTFVTALS